MNAVGVGTLSRRAGIKPSGKATARGPCPPGRIFDLLREPAGRPVSIAAFILRSYLGCLPATPSVCDG